MTERPVFAFCLPRSGSTLLMRLANRCLDEHGNAVVMRGENRCMANHLQSVKRLYDEIRDYEQNTSGGTLADVEARDLFPSCWNEFDDEAFRQSLANVVCAWISADAATTWGFKETNHGLNGAGKLEELTQFLRWLFPGARFWVHLRSIDQVVNSMMKCPRHWFGRCRIKARARIVKQRQAFVHLAAEWDDVLHTYYSDLRDYDKFADKVSTLGWTISETDYSNVTNKVLK